VEERGHTVLSSQTTDRGGPPALAHLTSTLGAPDTSAHQTGDNGIQAGECGQQQYHAMGAKCRYGRVKKRVCARMKGGKMAFSVAKVYKASCRRLAGR